MRRRTLLHAIPAASTALLLGSGGAAMAATGSFESFLVEVDRMAAGTGVSYATRRAALYGLRPNSDVIRLDNYQPEFTQTWAQYSAKRLSPVRVAAGQQKYTQSQQILAAIRTEYGVDPGVILGIWGLETNYGSYTGGFSVVQALATLGWSSHRPTYFRSELIAGLQVILGPSVDAPAIDPQQSRPLSQWLAMGVRRLPGHPYAPVSLPARIVQPDGAGGAAFMVYPNYKAIRRYNPSDFYALSVGLLGNLVTA
jgi:membrane-bound lytic murein transglycosylase B